MEKKELYEDDIKLYIETCKSFIKFMLNQRQWSGLTSVNTDNWLRNFHDQPIEKQYYAYRLLTNLIYISENDIVDALRAGVNQCLSKQAILTKQKQNNFTLSAHTLSKISDECISKACFVPLLDRDSPHESGNNMSRSLVQEGIITDKQSVFIKDAPLLFKEGNYKQLVIVDDCVGSGDQLRGFWPNTIVEDNGIPMTIKSLCQKYDVTANYLTLFGYVKSVEKLKREFPELNIFCVRELSEEHRVFSDTSYVWEDKEERDNAIAYFEETVQNAGIQLLGYSQLDFAFIMHKTIPDWSLPMLWKKNANWELLLRRKNSDG